jgi:hypothetical protein
MKGDMHVHRFSDREAFGTRTLVRGVLSSQGPDGTDPVALRHPARAAFEAPVADHSGGSTLDQLFQHQLRGVTDQVLAGVNASKSAGTTELGQSCR